jgi:hypothetical protein
MPIGSIFSVTFFGLERKDGSDEGEVPCVLVSVRSSSEMIATDVRTDETFTVSVPPGERFDALVLVTWILRHLKRPQYELNEVSMPIVGLLHVVSGGAVPVKEVD